MAIMRFGSGHRPERSPLGLFDANEANKVPVMVYEHLVSGRGWLRLASVLTNLKDPLRRFGMTGRGHNSGRAAESSLVVASVGTVTYVEKLRRQRGICHAELGFRRWL